MEQKRLKRPRDPVALAKVIGDIATGQVADKDPAAIDKDQEAANRGRKGGLKGGQARARTLSAKERSKIAQKAARSRWKSK